MELSTLPYHNSWEKGGVRMCFSGEMSPADILNANLAFYEDYRSDEARYQILDCLDVTALSDDPKGYSSTMETLAAMDAGSSFSLGSVKVALVASRRDVVEMFERYAGITSDIETGWNTGIFDSLESARAWIAAGS
jgi:hypothetical protein